jgi:hypothetical protein
MLELQYPAHCFLVTWVLVSTGLFTIYVWSHQAEQAALDLTLVYRLP